MFGRTPESFLNQPAISAWNSVASASLRMTTLYARLHSVAADVAPKFFPLRFLAFINSLLHLFLRVPEVYRLGYRYLPGSFFWLLYPYAWLEDVFSGEQQFHHFTNRRTSYYLGYSFSGVVKSQTRRTRQIEAVTVSAGPAWRRMESLLGTCQPRVGWRRRSSLVTR